MTTYHNRADRSGTGRAALNAMASLLWRVPGRFGIARALGCSSLRCVVFHDVSPTESAFTNGMGVSTTPSTFETTLRFLAKYYHPVSLQDVLDERNGRPLPERAALVTFDDGYASVMNAAVPICQKLGVPAVFFLNAAVLNNQRLSPDNLVCYVANTHGVGTINSAARAVLGDRAPILQSLMEVFARFFPSISLSEREAFLKKLIELTNIDEHELAMQSALYLTGQQVRELSSAHFEIGNHTRTHVRCRCLSSQHFYEEIDRNKTELERLSGKAVRSFSVPYGSAADLSLDLFSHLRQTGHELIFLSEAVSNPIGERTLDRVGPRGDDDATLFLELELLPRLRTLRNRMTGRNTANRIHDAASSFQSLNPA